MNITGKGYAIRYPPEALPGETRKQYHARELNRWRMEEKRRLATERGWTCEREGCEARMEHLDECLVTKGDARGLSIEQYRLVFASCNLALLCARHNVEEAHDRDGAWARAVARYGRERVVAWYASLGLKAPRRDWMVDDQEPA